MVIETWLEVILTPPFENFAAISNANIKRKWKELLFHPFRKTFIVLLYEPKTNVLTFLLCLMQSSLCLTLRSLTQFLPDACIHNSFSRYAHMRIGWELGVRGELHYYILWGDAEFFFHIAETITTRGSALNLSQGVWRKWSQVRFKTECSYPHQCPNECIKKLN